MRNLILFALTLTGAIHAQEIAGDWQGTLKMASGDLRLVLHVSKGAGGGLIAVLDSPEQDAFGIPVSEISFDNATLTFNSEAIHGSYTGKVNADSITGMWTQGLSTPLEFKRVATGAAQKPSELDGVWLGAIELGATKLRVAVHVFSSSDGLKATMDSLDQNAKGIPITSVTRSGAIFKMEVAPIQGSYEGTLDDALTTISGTWKQGAGAYPLVLKRVKDRAELEVRRPQNPLKPYPYREENVSYENKSAGIKLAATITYPAASGSYPAVLLIPGSGPNDRNESLLGHKPFLVLADYLTRKGIVVLRADKRGIGESGGDGNTATTLDYASDAEAGVAFLKTRPEVDPHRIGLIGHSEGGMVAPIVAARDSDIAFIVMLAGSGVPGDELLVDQVRALTLSMGQSKDDAEKAATYEREILDLIKANKDDAALREKLTGKVPADQMQTLTSPWFRYLLDYQPEAALSKLKIPVLALNGSLDSQVPAKPNLEAIQKALTSAGNKNFETDELPGLNHLFQTARTGSPKEYGEIEETMSPIAMQKVASWILKESAATSAGASK